MRLEVTIPDPLFDQAQHVVAEPGFDRMAAHVVAEPGFDRMAAHFVEFNSRDV